MKEKCKFCGKGSRRADHEDICWLNPANMKVILRLIAAQIVERSSFNHLHFSIFVRTIDEALKARDLTALSTIFNRIGFSKMTREEKLIGFIEYAHDNGFWDVESFPPPFLYMLDGYHCFPRDEGQARVDFALKLERQLLY